MTVRPMRCRPALTLCDSPLARVSTGSTTSPPGLSIRRSREGRRTSQSWIREGGCGRPGHRNGQRDRGHGDRPTGSPIRHFPAAPTRHRLPPLSTGVGPPDSLSVCEIHRTSPTSGRAIRARVTATVTERGDAIAGNVRCRRVLSHCSARPFLIRLAGTTRPRHSRWLAGRFSPRGWAAHCPAG